MYWVEIRRCLLCGRWRNTNHTLSFPVESQRSSGCRVRRCCVRSKAVFLVIWACWKHSCIGNIFLWVAFWFNYIQSPPQPKIPLVLAKKTFLIIKMKDIYQTESSLFDLTPLLDSNDNKMMKKVKYIDFTTINLKLSLEEDWINPTKR